MNAAPDSTPLSITRHPPEHGSARAPEVLPAGCCCCCCCCCLHTLGGIGGAVMGSTMRLETRPWGRVDPDSPFPYRRDVFEEDEPLIHPVLLYWLMVMLLVAVLVVGTYVYNGASNPSTLVWGAFLAVMVLPALQLIASLLAVVVVALFYPERSYSLRRVGVITLWSFVGMSLGLLIMGGCTGALWLGLK